MGRIVAKLALPAAARSCGSLGSVYVNLGHVDSRREDMSVQPQVVGGFIEGSAGRLAFQIGQAVEAVVIDRATRFALLEVGTDHQAIVMDRHVRQALDGSVFEEACTRVGVIRNDEEGGEYRKRIAN